MSYCSPEDAKALKSMGFDDQQIKKLYNLSGEELKNLLPQASKKQGIPRGPKAKKGDYFIVYNTTCLLCGHVKEHHSTAICKKEWVTLSPFYTSGKGNCKVNSCSKCRQYLMTLPQTQLIDIILSKKKDIPVSIPKIERYEDEHTYYPMMVVDKYCSFHERN